MGLDVTPILVIGKSFSDRQEAVDWFKAHRTLSEDELDEIGNELCYYLERREKEGFPQAHTLDNYSRDGEFYMGYKIYHYDPQKLVENMAKYDKMWEELFGEKAEVVLDVWYH